MTEENITGRRITTKLTGPCLRGTTPPGPWSPSRMAPNLRFAVLSPVCVSQITYRFQGLEQGRRQAARGLRLQRRCRMRAPLNRQPVKDESRAGQVIRSEEHTSELQSLRHLVCRL